MTATERLRAMLDERGVEWMDDSYAQLWCTVWHGQDGKQWRMTENRSGMLTELKAWQATPEQAIEATLGHAYEPPLAAHWDGDTLTLTIPRDPSCIRVQRSAEQPCKVYADESKVIAATLGSEAEAENTWPKKAYDYWRGMFEAEVAENAELRDDLQRANDAVRDAEHDESRAWDRVRKAEAEADRLRELVRDMVDWAYISDYCDLEEQFAERMRELGIEVDG